MQHRHDIDGLRALAVLPVIFYHAGFHSFPGGYVGVDVFFVISGFLITSIILHEHSSNRFSFARFYERRARRILPALFTVILACIPFAWWLLPPLDLKDFSQSIVAVLTFSSNFLFAAESGYFERAAEFKPLLHTWSLSVEEQFYLLFPVLLAAIWNRGQPFLRNTLISVIALSLSAAFYLEHANPAVAFYWLPPRAWELAAGAIIATLHRTTSFSTGRMQQQVWSALGLGLIVTAILVGDTMQGRITAFQVAAVLGACLIIAFSTPSTWVGRLLGTKAMVGVGLVSYSAYLWHQPVLVFARFHNNAAATTLQLFMAICATLFLAGLTWHFIEQPFRNRQSRPGRPALLLALGLGVIVFAFGALGHLSNGYSALRTTTIQQQWTQSIGASPRRNQCHLGERTSHFVANDAQPPCQYGLGATRYAIFGDSHAVELAYAVGMRLANTDSSLLHFTYSGCSPSFGRQVKADMAACAGWTETTVRRIAQNKDIDTVLIAYRLNSHLFGTHEATYPAQANSIGDLERVAVWKSFVDTVRYFRGSGKRVVVILQAPELPRPITDLIFQNRHESALLPGVTRAWWDARSAFVQRHAADLGSDVQIIDPTGLFCDADRCTAGRNGTAYYFDDHHLSVAGANLVAAEVLRATALSQP